MAAEGPSWADQWGAGGIGAIEEDDKTKTQKDGGDKKKGDAKAGLFKAKTVALVGAQKIKSGTSNGIKWIKNHCQKKSASK
ncbi:putative Ankyrin repeat protein [Quillaja saponaria]|uniref:Ankyrin repeat protein n=1 Tax=Quillaja saponaria TaxID=32244 RepID=A0AAD7M0I9_QUISA|nr:putative Ankyrin repeat protein [Quillaja saponaria]